MEKKLDLKSVPLEDICKELLERTTETLICTFINGEFEAEHCKGPKTILITLTTPLIK
ncbi:MAG: hypothetical protein HUK04_07490 [Bacteroidaceae bacterium]|uniref:hypothetical protein n=1 Tax=Fusobacterium varium TaxID=856 RepID=UPI00242B51E1|nr:hypothetical protein [Fusobacterium varium]MCF0171602.1 hypothetical protein [Fusobacterium varium]MCF0189315.1 hypothetical protein [Bacteroidaceae bacterium]